MSQTLYLRSSASSVVSGTATVNLLSTTAGSTKNTSTSVKNAKNTGTWQFIPGTSSNTTTFTPGTTPDSKGWIFDASAAGTYAAGTWTVQVEQHNSSSSSAMTIGASIWVVTATTTAVTSVSQIANNVKTTSYTPGTVDADKTITISSVPTVTLTSGQYLYIELYLQVTGAGASTTGTETLTIDDPTTSTATFITTPAFTPTGTNWTQSASSSMSFDALNSYSEMVLSDNPIAYYRCNDTGTTLTDSSSNGLNGSIGANCTTGGSALISGDSTAKSIQTPGGTVFDTAHTCQVAHNAIFNVSSVTLEAWVQMVTASNNDMLGYIINPSTEHYLFWNSQTNVTATFDATGGAFSPTTSGGALGTGVHHLVATYDSTTGIALVYLDGKLITVSGTSSGAITGYTTSSIFVIGGAGTSDMVNMNVSEVAVYNYVLTPDRILAHYKMGLAPTEGFLKSVGKALSGALSFTGALATSLTTAGNHFTQALSGALSFTGTMAKRDMHQVSGALSFTGNVVKAASHGLTSGLSFTGAIKKAFTRAISGSMSFTGGLIKSIGKNISAGLTFVGNIPARAMSRGLSAAVTFTGLNGKSVTRLVSSALSFSGNVTKRVTHAFTASLSFTGNLIVNVIHLVNLASGLSFTGGFNKSVAAPLSSALSFTGSVKKAVTRAISSGSSFTGNIAKTLARAYTSAVSFAGILVVSTTHLVNLTSALNFSGSVKKGIGKGLSSGLSFTGTIVRNAAYHIQLAANSAFSGSIKKNISRSLSASISFAGNIAKSVKHLLSSAASFAGSLQTNRLLLKALTASLNFTGSYSRSIGGAITSGLSFVGTQSKAVTHSLTAASTSFSGVVSTVFNSVLSQAQYILALVVQFTSTILERPAVTSVYTTATAQVSASALSTKANISTSQTTALVPMTNTIITARVTMERIQ